MENNQGVCGWSGSTRWEDWAIFCVGNNPIRDGAFTTWATGIGLRFKSLIGAYKGQTERSYLCRLSDLEKVRAHGWIGKEESVLILRPERREDGHMALWSGARIVASLQWQNGEETAIGFWSETTERGAKAQDGWTYDPTQDAWFSVFGNVPDDIAARTLRAS